MSLHYTARCHVCLCTAILSGNSCWQPRFNFTEHSTSQKWERWVQTDTCVVSCLQFETHMFSFGDNIHILSKMSPTLEWYDAWQTHNMHKSFPRRFCTFDVQVRWPNVVLMLGHRVRQSPNIKTTLSSCLLNPYSEASESDVCRRRILKPKVDPRTVRVSHFIMAIDP